MLMYSFFDHQLFPFRTRFDTINGIMLFSILKILLMLTQKKAEHNQVICHLWPFLLFDAALSSVLIKNFAFAFSWEIMLWQICQMEGQMTSAIVAPPIPNYRYLPLNAKTLSHQFFWEWEKGVSRPATFEMCQRSSKPGLLSVMTLLSNPHWTHRLLLQMGVFTLDANIKRISCKFSCSHRVWIRPSCFLLLSSRWSPQR